MFRMLWYRMMGSVRVVVLIFGDVRRCNGRRFVPPLVVLEEAVLGYTYSGKARNSEKYDGGGDWIGW